MQSGPLQNLVPVSLAVWPKMKSKSIRNFSRHILEPGDNLWLSRSRT